MNIRCIFFTMVLSVGMLQWAQAQEEAIFGDKKGKIRVGSRQNQSPNTAFAEINLHHGGSYDETFAAIRADRPSTDRKGRLYFMTRNGNTMVRRMTIDEVGRVGIKENNPSSELDVKGKIEADEIQCRVSGGADFVFENSYPLPSLEQVKTHIQANGHLQDIPSAAEMVEDGLNLGDMNVRLLQKIEELTLYLIEQDERLTDLTQQNRTLQQEVEQLKQ